MCLPFETYNILQNLKTEALKQCWAWPTTAQDENAKQKYPIASFTSWHSHITSLQFASSTNPALTIFKSNISSAIPTWSIDGIQEMAVKMLRSSATEQFENVEWHTSYQEQSPWALLIGFIPNFSLYNLYPMQQSYFNVVPTITRWQKLQYAFRKHLSTLYKQKWPLRSADGTHNLLAYLKPLLVNWGPCTFEIYRLHHPLGTPNSSSAPSHLYSHLRRSVWTSRPICSQCQNGTARPVLLSPSKLTVIMGY